MNQARADLVKMYYGQGKVHYASRELPYYADLLPSLVIHETRPGQTRPDALYVTNGLSAPTPDNPLGYGFELQMIAPPNTTWPVTLLVSLAAHALRLEHPFSYGEAIALADTLTGASDTLSALIFTRAPGLPNILTVPEGTIQLVTVVGITADEHEWARKYSAHDLLAMLLMCGQGVATLPGRHSVIHDTEAQRRSA